MISGLKGAGSWIVDIGKTLLLQRPMKFRDTMITQNYQPHWKQIFLMLANSEGANPKGSSMSMRHKH